MDTRPRRNNARFLSALIGLLFASALFAAPPAKVCTPVGDLGREPGLNELIARHKKFGLVDARDNAKFLKLAETASDKGWVFLDVELSVLKELNDRVFGDKDVVTALSNAYKEMFFARLEKAFAGEPDLAKLLEGKYSDFKSIRLAYDGRGLGPADRAKLEKILDAVYRETGEEFSAFVLKDQGLSTSVRNAHGIAAEPRWWHFGGIGHTADLAGVVGRDARALYGKDVLRLHTFAERKAALDAKVVQIHGLRGEMARLAPKGSELTEASRFDAEQSILSADAIDIFRKGKGDSRDEYIANVKTALEKRFGTRLTKEFVEAAKDYMTAVDGFSPGVNSVERVIIDNSAATHGQVSVDFAGQGARNIREAMSDLIAAHKSGRGAEEAVRLARQGEARATKEMTEMRETFETLCKEVFGKDVGKYYFSGDDGMFMPRFDTGRNVATAEKLSLIRKLAASKFSGSYRLTFLPQEAPVAKRSRLIVQSETVEKDIRKKLEGKVPRDVLKRLMIVPEAVLQGDRVVMQVYLAGHSRDEIDLRAKIRDAMNEVMPQGVESGPLINVYPEGYLLSDPSSLEAKADHPAKAHRHRPTIFPRRAEAEIPRRRERGFVEAMSRAA